MDADQPRNRVLIARLSTLEAATAVSAIVSEAFGDYDALGAVEVPDLLSTSDDVILDEFEDLTRALEAGS